MLVMECCLFFFGSGDDNAIPQNDMIGPLNYAAFSINSCIFFSLRFESFFTHFHNSCPCLYWVFVVVSSVEWASLKRSTRSRFLWSLFFDFFFFFYQIKKKRLRALNTYLFQWNVFTNTFSRFF